MGGRGGGDPSAAFAGLVGSCTHTSRHLSQPVPTAAPLADEVRGIWAQVTALQLQAFEAARPAAPSLGAPNQPGRTRKHSPVPHTLHLP